MVEKKKKFYLIGDGKVFDVYLRPSLIDLSVGYGLKIACWNLRKENRVEAIVKGTDENIQEFWNYVKDHDIRRVKKGKPYTVSKIEPYNGEEPDWTYYMSASTMEQISKGVRSLEAINKIPRGLEGINKTLQEIDRRFSSLDERFGLFGLYAKSMDEKLDALPKRLAEILREGKSEKSK